jgi:hypothetical protein
MNPDPPADMAGGDGGMAAEGPETMDEGMHEQPGEPAEPNHAAETDGFTAFLPKEITAGKTFKPGDEIILSVKAVDPDTGELEVQYAKEKGMDSGSVLDHMPEE